MFMRVFTTRINIIGLSIGLFTISLFCQGCSEEASTPIPGLVVIATESRENINTLYTPEAPGSLNGQTTDATEQINKSPRVLVEPSLLPPTVKFETPMITSTWQNDEKSDSSLANDSWDNQHLLFISNIGDGSQVLSPIHLEIQAVPSDDISLILTLYGQDGRLIVRRLLSLSEMKLPQLIEVDLRFEIADSSEQGRLVVSSKDDANRINYLHSRDILLRSDGEERIVEPDKQYELTITFPSESNTVSGGVLTVAGESCSQSLEPLRVSLVRNDGSVVGQRIAGLMPGSEGKCASFAVEIGYRVDDRTPVRLMVYQSGSPISELKYLTSIPIVLTP